MTIKRFEDLEVWQAARKYANLIYQNTSSREFEKDWDLRNQLRRAAVSVMANIAEGFDRSSKKDFIRFLTILLASASEVKSHLYLAYDLRYISKEDFDLCLEGAEGISKQLTGFSKYLRSYNK